MPKILLMNDIHLDEKSPISRKSSYLDELFAKIDDCRQIAKISGADFTFLTGDVFHRHRGVTYSLLSRTIAHFKDWPTKIIAVAGNHDLSEAGIVDVNRQPIAVLEEAGVLKLLHNQGMWLDDNQTYVQFFGYDSNSLKKYKTKRPKGCRFFILICHDMLLPLDTFIGPYIPHQQVAVNTDFDAVFYGHVHFDLGLTKVKNTYFLSAGSLSRVAKNESNINRKMRVAVAEITDGRLNVQFYPLVSAKSAEEIFVDDKPVPLKDERFSEYVQKITGHVIPTIDIHDYIVNLDVEQDIKDKISHYIFEAK